MLLTLLNATSGGASVAVAYVSSSTFGATDTSAASLNVPVPASTAAGHVALLVIKQDGSGNPTVTWPAGFTEKINLANANLKLKVAWKRLTGADAGNYTMSWTGSQFVQGQCILLSGAIATGDPIEASNTAVSSFTLPQPSVSITTATSLFLVHFGGTLNFRTSTQPTGYTRVQDANYLDLSYLVAGSVGSQTASGGSVTGTATDHNVALLAILPDTGGSSVTGTISGTLPAFTGSITAAVRVSGTATGSLPAITGSLTGTARASATLAGTLPAITGSLTGSLKVRATLAGNLPAFTGSLSGALKLSGSVTGSLPALTGSLTGDVSTPGTPATGTLSGSLPTLQGSVSGTVKAAGVLAGQLPAITSAATGVVRVSATLSGTLQAILGALTGTAGPVVEYVAPDSVTATPRNYASAATPLARESTATAREPDPTATARQYVSTATARSPE